MTFKCTFGFHSWTGCKCTICGKIRNEQHNWSKDCERCSICGKTVEHRHSWDENCEKCSKCGKTRDNQHVYLKDCEKCSTCGNIIEDKHNWIGCKCSNCGKIRDEQHDWSKDCKKCSNCGKSGISEHNWVKNFCSICGQFRRTQGLEKLEQILSYSITDPMFFSDVVRGIGYTMSGETPWGSVIMEKDEDRFIISVDRYKIHSLVYINAWENIQVTLVIDGKRVFEYTKF